jgi:ABC-type phosphate/phosphonate transport system substrate-binding protein
MASATGAASWPMYDLPELDRSHDRLWSLVRAELAGRGTSTPDRLSHRPRLPEAWTRPDLVVSQTCGWPLVTELGRRVTTIGTFRYRIAGAEGGTYRSRIVGRRAPSDLGLGDLVGRTAAVNARDSLSGWVSLVAGLGLSGGWPGPVLVTGGHAESLRALADGRADVASIDAVTYALVERLRPELVDHLVDLGSGPRVPCLPIIGPAGLSGVQLATWRRALSAAITGTGAAPVRDALLIEAFTPMDLADYEAALEPLRAMVDTAG